jgi:hypothetical protein
MNDIHIEHKRWADSHASCHAHRKALLTATSFVRVQCLSMICVVDAVPSHHSSLSDRVNNLTQQMPLYCVLLTLSLPIATTYTGTGRS